MNIFEIISGIVLLAASVFLIIVVLLQDNDDQRGMNALSGVSADSYYNRNSKARTKQHMLAKWTKITGIVFFVVVILMDILAVILA